MPAWPWTYSDVDNRSNHIRICGDNLGVIRYCADTGSARRADLHEILDATLGRTATQGWNITWEAVMRRHNTGADKAATTGCRRAATLAAAGVDTVGTTLHEGASWYDPSFQHCTPLGTT